jgi:pimeloyl-ACP methyl ester carboxylesterase
VVVADLIARTEAASYVLIGHSLGARAMAVAAETLGTNERAPRIEAAHLTGAAIGAEGDWTNLTARVDDAVYGYHSSDDGVLKWLYRTAQGGQRAAGSTGFTPAPAKLVNVDVTDCVHSHADYYTEVGLR